MILFRIVTEVLGNIQLVRYHFPKELVLWIHFLVKNYFIFFQLYFKPDRTRTDRLQDEVMTRPTQDQPKPGPRPSGKTAGQARPPAVQECGPGKTAGQDCGPVKNAGQASPPSKTTVLDRRPGKTAGLARLLAGQDRRARPSAKTTGQDRRPDKTAEQDRQPGKTAGQDRRPGKTAKQDRRARPPRKTAGWARPRANLILSYKQSIYHSLNQVLKSFQLENNFFTSKPGKNAGRARPPGKTVGQKRRPGKTAGRARPPSKTAGQSDLELQTIYLPFFESTFKELSDIFHIKAGQERGTGKTARQDRWARPPAGQDRRPGKTAGRARLLAGQDRRPCKTAGHARPPAGQDCGQGKTAGQSDLELEKIYLPFFDSSKTAVQDRRTGKTAKQDRRARLPAGQDSRPGKTAGQSNFELPTIYLPFFESSKTAGQDRRPGKTAKQDHRARLPAGQDSGPGKTAGQARPPSGQDCLQGKNTGQDCGPGKTFGQDRRPGKTTVRARPRMNKTQNTKHKREIKTQIGHKNKR